MANNRQAMKRGRLGVEVLSLFCPSSPQDSAIVVESFKSGFEPPGDFPFEDFSQNLSRTGSDGTISNTPKGERERDGAPGQRPDPKHPMSRTKNKLWLFGKKPKVRGEVGGGVVVALNLQLFIYWRPRCQKDDQWIQSKWLLRLQTRKILAASFEKSF